MSSIKRDDWPEIGELVVATVNEIRNYGVYVMLDEYGKEGFLHTSEISSSWVKNIRDFVREGEKVVLKVLRVDPEKGHIDLSLRRVTKRERREKMLLWKQSKKAESIMRSLSQKLNISLDEIHEKVWIPLEETFGTAYEGLEKAAMEGANPLIGAGLPHRIAGVLAEIAKEKIRITSVKVQGTLRVSCRKPDGVLRIKKAFAEAEKVKIPNGSSKRIYVISSPRYRIEVTARDYKTANIIFQKIADIVMQSIKRLGGEGKIERG